MRSPDRISALRWTLLALALALPATVVCKRIECTDCAEADPTDPASYETSFGCEGGDLTVTAGTASDVADAIDCFGVSEASASDTIDGIGAQVDFLARHGGDGVTVTCAYHIEADLAQPVTCDGDTLRPAQFFYLSGADPVQFQISALSTAVADGDDTGSFDPRVFITCPGDSETMLPADGVPVRTLDLPLSNTDCAIRIDMNSAASAAGATYHSVTLTLGDTTNCYNDADCPGGLRCTSNHTCQDGGAGDPCASSHLPSGGGDCGASAPLCVSGPGLVNARCSDGSDGSACAGNFHCVDSKCIETFPGLGVCQDGSPVDLCLADADCQAGCTCFKQGGTRGNCLGDCAPPGEAGDFCMDAIDCNPPWGCVSLGTQSICYRCTLDAQCAPGETCLGGECRL